jgi:hypothetical protein
MGAGRHELGRSASGTPERGVTPGVRQALAGGAALAVTRALKRRPPRPPDLSLGRATRLVVAYRHQLPRDPRTRAYELRARLCKTIALSLTES